MLLGAYCRVSTGRQEQEETIQNQIMAIKDFAKNNGHTIVKWYLDENWSGSILARPALDEMRLDARKDIWEAAISYDPDRVARKYSYQELIIDELTEIRKQILFVTTPPPKDDADRLLYGVKGLFAEYERARIAERFRLGKLRKAREGNVVTSQAPYGYDYVLKQANVEGHYKINKQEAAVVKMIFHWIANERLTMRALIRRLQEMGIPPRKSQRGVWNTSTLTTLLRNETYIGTAHYNRSYAVVPENPLKNEKYKKVKKTSRKIRPEEEWIRIPVPATIGKSLFEKARRQLKANYELSKRNKKNQYLLAGLISCVCGKRRAGEGPQRGKHLYYRCTDRVYSFPLPPKCRERGVNARIADKLVWDGVAGIMSNPKILRRQVEKWMGHKQDDLRDDSQSLEELKPEIERLKKEEARYLKVYGAGVISLEQFQEAVSDLRKKREVLEKELGHFKTNGETAGIIKAPSDSELERFCQAAKSVLSELDFEPKQAIVRKVIDSVIADQKTLRVRGYLSLKEVEYVKLWSISRNRRSSKRRKVNIV